MANTSTDLHELGELVERYRGGDNRALDELATRMRPLLRTAARAFLVSSDDVDDAIQDAWVAFIRSRDRIADPRCVKSWLWTTTTNAARRISMRQARSLVSDDVIAVLDSRLDTANSLEDAIVTAEERAAVEQALAEADPTDRELLGLLLDGRALGYREISRLIERPIGSIGPSRDRAIRRLRRHPQVAKLLSAA
jgi:RNA polymerase sigma factor (sigma-70 family)